MNILSITPDQFASTATAWIGAAVAVVTALALAASVVLPKLAAMKAQLEDLKGRQDRQSADIKTNTATITQIALATPPPSKASPSPTADQTKPTS